LTTIPLQESIEDNARFSTDDLQPGDLQPTICNPAGKMRQFRTFRFDAWNFKSCR